MNLKLRTIEIDAETADLLEARAAARGMSISELLADIAGNQEVLPPDLARMRASGQGPWSAETIAEDARRLADFEQTRLAVPWEEIKSWMKSWGSADELPPPQPRKL